MKYPNFPNPTDLKTIIPQVRDDSIDLIKNMLKWDSNDRMTANNLLNHLFFTNYIISQVVSIPVTVIVIFLLIFVIMELEDLVIEDFLK